MELAKIPQILTLLEQQGVIDATQKQEIISTLDHAQKEGRKAFAGEVGIELGFFDRQTLDNSLVQQTALKAEAAVKDIQTIAQQGPQDAPNWLQANWGNNGVNALDNPTVSDAVSAAANIAQNLVMIANTHPQVAAELVDAVAASANLARGMTQGASPQVPLNTKAQEWLKASEAGLRTAIEKTGYQPKDRNGADIDINAFISAHYNAINKGVEQALGKSQSGRIEGPAPSPAQNNTPQNGQKQENEEPAWKKFINKKTVIGAAIVATAALVGVLAMKSGKNESQGRGA